MSMAESEAAGVPFADHLAERGICSREIAAELLSPKRMRKLGFEEGEYEGMRLRRPEGADGPLLDHPDTKKDAL